MMLLFTSNTSFAIAISMKYYEEPFTVNNQVRTSLSLVLYLIIIPNHTVFK